MCLVFSLRFMLTYPIRFLSTEMQNCQEIRSLDMATELVHKSTNKITFCQWYSGFLFAKY